MDTDEFDAPNKGQRRRSVGPQGGSVRIRSKSVKPPPPPVSSTLAAVLAEEDDFATEVIADAVDEARTTSSGGRGGRIMTDFAKQMAAFKGDYVKASMSSRQKTHMADRLLRHQKRVKYGQGSLDAVLRRRILAKRKGDQPYIDAIEKQIQARMTDEFTGKGRYRRKRRRYKGRGMYTGSGNYMAAIGSGARMARPGVALATSLVGGVAGALGKNQFARRTTRIGGAIDTGLGILGGAGMYVRGRGSYAVPGAVGGNSLIEGMGSSIPNFGTLGDETGALIVRHTEFVSDIYGNKWVGGANTEPFTNRPYSLNPGLTSSFPFASQVANNFEEYEFGQLMYTFKTKVSTNLTSTDGQVGSILMYTDYNASDPPKRSKQKVMQSYGNTNVKITDTGIHGVECDPSKIPGDGHRFTRSQPPSTASGESLSKYDHGLFQIMVVNTPEALSEQVIGELYVSYTLILRKPRVHTLYGLSLDRDEFLMEMTAPDMIPAQTVIKYGSQNSIDCAVEVTGDLTASGGPLGGGYKITFPASFAGDVEIKCVKTGVDLGDLRPFAPVYAGEVRPLEILPFEHEDVLFSSRNFTSGYNSASTTDKKEFNSSCWVNVSQAISGTDNTVTLGTPHGSGQQYGATELWLIINRWNGRESTASESFAIRVAE